MQIKRKCQVCKKIFYCEGCHWSKDCNHRPPEVCICAKCIPLGECLPNIDGWATRWLKKKKEWRIA